MDKNVYRFMKEMDFEKSFSWNPEWSALQGIEKAVNYTAEFMDLGTLKGYNPNKHLGNSFTGFVKVLEESVNINGVNKEANYLYLENGKIKFLQQAEKYDDTFYQNISFFNDNFTLNKTYVGEEEGSLFDVSLQAKFKLGELVIDFYRQDDESSIAIWSRYARHLSLEIPEEKMFSLNEGVFNDYENLCSFFENVNANVYSNMRPFARGIPFKEAILNLK